MYIVTLAYAAAILPLVIIDGVWLMTVSKRFYAPRISHLLSDSVSLAPVVIFYLLYAVGIVLLVILPALRDNTTTLLVCARGAMLGLVAYGAYDLTNQATLRDWPLSVTIVDMVWGAILTGIVCAIAINITRSFS